MARMKQAVWSLAAALVLAAGAQATEFASKGGPPPGNVDELMEVLREDPYDMELLISFGTSKGGSAGHLALAIRDHAPGDDLVYSANFYADRKPEHEGRHYTDDLMTMIPKKEYLFGTVSSLGDKASFGLDFGEIYKRSVIGVRVYGVPTREKESLAAFFKQVNDDFRRRATKTGYHIGEITYGYMDLNCAKTIGAGFRYGAGYKGLEVKQLHLSSRRKAVAAAKANIPAEMAVKLLREWDARGYRLDVVLYKKYERSTYVDPHEEKKVAFKDLPNRFPSVLSFDFLSDQGQYEDYDNLFAMYVLYNMGKYSVQVNESTRLLEIEASKYPMAYPQAAAAARKSARSDSKGFLRRLPFIPRGTRLGAEADNTPLYDYKDEGRKVPAP
jgi:hypothetical protein